MKNTYSNMYNESVVIPTIKKKIRELRKEAGLTQRTFAERAGIAHITIQKWESDKNNIIPDVVSLVKLCNAYHVDFDYFTGRLDAHDRDTDFVMEYTGLSEKAVLKLAEMKRSHYDATRVLDHLLQIEARRDSYTGRLSAQDGMFFLQSIANYFAERQLTDLFYDHFAGNTIVCDLRGNPAQDPDQKPDESEVMSYCMKLEKQKDITEFHISKDLPVILDTIYDAFKKQTPINAASITPKLTIRRKDPQK